MRHTALVAATALAIGTASEAAAQAVYRYRDASGAWVYTDRPPAEEPTLEVLESQARVEQPTVEFLEQETEGGRLLLIRNTYHGPVHVSYELTRDDNVRRDVPRRGNRVVDARSEAVLFEVSPADRSETMVYALRFQYVTGDPSARHEPETDYRLPFALASSHVVTQAYPARVTHQDESSRHAIDFALPEGTQVFAARSGVVVEIAADFFEAGQDAADAARANFVRVLHDDGTLGLYAHLGRSSIRVRPGQRVERGERIADSGNTGFSSGPHLHFVVQRNDDGRMVSVPVTFAGFGGSSVEVQTGDVVTAY